MSKLFTFIKLIICKSLCRTYLCKAHKISYHQKAASRVGFNQFVAVAFTSWLTKSITRKTDTKKQFDVENEISQSIYQAEIAILNGNLKEAKNILNSAIQLADDNEAYANLTYLCDLLSTIILSEGDFFEAENILVKFTERLLQLGYSETHNTIVAFKLKIARIHQLLGSLEMAAYGFRDCIRVQEKKIERQKQLDEESNGIYLTALYWYGKLLTDQRDFNQARKQLKFCWQRILKSKNVLPSQKMVVLHNIANVSAHLKDFDNALQYLYAAIEICLLEDPNNIDLPILIIQVGLIFLQKEIYESASFWCKAGHELAVHEENELAKTEGQKCFSELQKLNILP